MQSSLRNYAWTKYQKFFEKTLDILMITNPFTISMSILLGFSIYTLIEVVAPILPNEFLEKYISKIKILYFIVLSLLIGILISKIRKRRLDDNIEKALSLISKARKEGGLSERQAKILYMQLYEKIIEDIAIKGEVKDLTKETDLSKLSKIVEKGESYG